MEKNGGKNRSFVIIRTSLTESRNYHQTIKDHSSCFWYHLIQKTFHEKVKFFHETLSIKTIVSLFRPNWRCLPASVFESESWKNLRFFQKKLFHEKNRWSAGMMLPTCICLCVEDGTEVERRAAGFGRRVHHVADAWSVHGNHTLGGNGYLFSETKRTDVNFGHFLTICASHLMPESVMYEQAERSIDVTFGKWTWNGKKPV